MEQLFTHAVSLAVGLSLAASCGLRAFLPLFVLAIVSRLGPESLSLIQSESLQWLQSTPALIALGDNHPRYAADYERIGSAAGFYDDYQDGNDPAGISTQDPELAARLDPIAGGHRLANYLRVLTMEAQTIARACGKAHVCHLEPDDLVAVNVEAAAMARVPLAGTDWIPGEKQ